MNYADGQRRLQGLRKDIDGVRRKMRTVMRNIEPEPVADFLFASSRGTIHLSELFGDQRDLIVIHNMGHGCAYCTLWADGYNGVYAQLSTRAALVLASPDAPHVQEEFAASRG